MNTGVEVAYKCTCAPVEVLLQVPFRREDEDLREWMESIVGAACYLDHRQRSPSCPSKNVEYVKVNSPDNAPFVGGKPVLN